jgi:hypothetical protein
VLFGKLTEGITIAVAGSFQQGQAASGNVALHRLTSLPISLT